MVAKYQVIEDLQGGSFGMGRALTASEWLEQATEWRDSDNNWGDFGGGTDCFGNKHKDSRSWWVKFWKRIIRENREQELLDFIEDIWQIRFERVGE